MPYTAMTAPDWFYGKLLANPQRYYREDYENKHKGDGELKECFFHASLGAVDCIGLAENAPQTATPHL